MNNYHFVGPFAEYIKNHVELKQAIGYKYHSEAKHLLRFSYFTNLQYPTAPELSKEIILAWCSKASYESQANQCSRASIMRQLAIYMDSIGIKAFIVPRGYFQSEEQYVPHIYTAEELKQFFLQTDKCHIVSTCPYRHLIMPIFFRILYSCGLRVSEVRLLKVKDVDIENGTFTINHSKKDNSRLVPMPDDLLERCKAYYYSMHTFTSENDYFFPNATGSAMTNSNIYHNFRRFLWSAGISHGGRGKGPRIHDFRHTFACHCLKKWVVEEKNLSVYLPILKTYMGHDSFSETAYYLRMTADVFPNITIQLEGRYPDIIPKLGGALNETD